jgi:F-type H+-transporting ATPase subunit epsilon
MTLELEVLVPDGVVLRERIRGLQAADASGRFGIWPGHEAFVSVLEPCILIFRNEEDCERFAAVDGGVMVLEDGLISIACREAIVADRLEEIADRAGAMLRHRRLQEQTARGEFAELQSTLMRQMKKAEVRK